MLFTILFWSIVVFVLAYLYSKWTSYRAFYAAVIKHGCKRPPKYPHRDPIWGIDLLQQRMKAVGEGRQMKLFMVHFNIIGKTWEENFFGTKVYNTMEVPNIQQIVALRFQDYGKPAQNFFIPFLGEVILSLEGAAWKHSRDLVKSVFSRSEVSDVETFRFHVDRFLHKIPCDGNTVDLQQPLHNLFLDTSTEFIFGQSIDSQLPDDPKNSKELLEAFMGALTSVGKRRLAGKLGHLIYAFDKSWKVDINKVYAYVDAHVKRALEETKTESKEKDSKDAAQARYVVLTEMAKEIKDPIKLRYQILNVLMTARDSSSILLANCLFHLARNPGVWTQLRAKSIALGDRPLTFELLKSLHSFRHVLHETLRLQGPAGRVQRLALRNTILPVGGGPDAKAAILVEKGGIVALNTWGTNHDEDIWGDDVDEFKPERWINRKMTWEFTPFLGGPRICPAQQQVLTQSVYLLV